MVRNTQNSGTLCFARQALPGGQQAGAKGSQCGGGPAGGAGLGQGGHCRGSGLCGGGRFRVGSLSRGVGCGGSFGAVGVVRVSRGFRGGGVCGDMRRGQSLVVWGLREGRDCAAAVDRYLMGYTNL